MTAQQLISILQKLLPDEQLFVEDEYLDPVEVLQVRKTDGKVFICTNDYLNDPLWRRSRPDLANEVIK